MSLLSGFCCVSCVPASCVHIWFVSCPWFMSLWVKYVPFVFVWLCVNYPVYLVPVFWVWFGLVYSLLPGVSCLSALSCPALSSLKTIIWVYILVCVSLFLPAVCNVTFMKHLERFKSVFFSAGQRLIASKIKVFVYIIYVCVLCIFIMYI